MPNVRINSFGLNAIRRDRSIRPFSKRIQPGRDGSERILDIDSLKIISLGYLFVRRSRHKVSGI